MKQLIAIFIFTFCITTAKADYGYLHLCEMLKKADYGAIGTIIKIDRNYFYLKVDKYLLNELNRDTLPIVKYENWSCGRRYAEYKVGQKEIVFFRKSNYVINDHELLGYGGGNEYELLIVGDSIEYQSSYGYVKKYGLNIFLNAISDYYKLFKNKNENRATPSESEKISFLKISPLHKKLIECEINSQEKEYRTPQKNKNNKLGLTPAIHFPHQKRDTIQYRYLRDAAPSVAVYLNNKLIEEYSEYRLLSYEYQIISNFKTETFKVKSEYGTRDFQDRLRALKHGDRITVSNIYALSPDKKLIQLKATSVIISVD